MNTDKNNLVPPKKVRICNFTQTAVNDFLTEIAESNISERLDISTDKDPNDNYEIIDNVIRNAKERHLPYKYVKFNKYKHKNSKWITKGIMKSIKVEECKSHVLIRTLSYFSKWKKISIQNYTFLESLLYQESTI